MNYLLQYLEMERKKMFSPILYRRFNAFFSIFFFHWKYNYYTFPKYHTKHPWLHLRIKNRRKWVLHLIKKEPKSNIITLSPSLSPTSRPITISPTPTPSLSHHTFIITIITISPTPTPPLSHHTFIITHTLTPHRASVCVSEDCCEGECAEDRAEEDEAEGEHTACVVPVAAAADRTGGAAQVRCAAVRKQWGEPMSRKSTIINVETRESENEKVKEKKVREGLAIQKIWTNKASEWQINHARTLSCTDARSFLISNTKASARTHLILNQPEKGATSLCGVRRGQKSVELQIAQSGMDVNCAKMSTWKNSRVKVEMERGQPRTIKSSEKWI